MKSRINMIQFWLDHGKMDIIPSDVFHGLAAIDEMPFKKIEFKFFETDFFHHFPHAGDEDLENQRFLSIGIKMASPKLRVFGYRRGCRTFRERATAPLASVSVVRRFSFSGPSRRPGLR